MLVKTEGIVLNNIKYSESSIIARIYTKEFGLLSFLIRGVRKRKSRFPASFFQPFSLLSLDISYKQKSGLQSVREISVAGHTPQLHSDIRKSTIALFLAEMVYKSLQEEEQDVQLFDFLKLSIEFLDSVEESFENFHLIFLMQLTRFLGFAPDSNHQADYFNMASGSFVYEPTSGHVLDKAPSAIIKALTKISYLERSRLNISATDRRMLLESIVEYYHLHLPGMSRISSLEVMEAVYGG